MRFPVAIFYIILFSVISFYGGYSKAEQDRSNALKIVDKGQLGRDFLIFSSDDNSFGFQVHNKKYEIMTFNTLNFLIESEVFFDKNKKEMIE